MQPVIATDVFDLMMRCINRTLRKVRTKRERQGSRSSEQRPDIFFGLSFAFAMMTYVTLACSMLTQEVAAMSGDRVNSMLEAINKIRERRDIELECEKYVYPFLGRSDRLKHYFDLFAAKGIQSSVVRQGPNRHIGFEINYPHLRKVPNSRFGALDVVVIVFVADGAEPNSTIHYCKAILKAAPQHL